MSKEAVLVITRVVYMVTKREGGQEMTKKKARLALLRLTGALTLAITLVFSMAIPAFADGWDEDSMTLEYEEGDTPTAAITKILKMPINTTTPAVTFTFEFEPIDVDGVDWDEATTGSNMPTIANSTIAFTASDTGTTVAGIKTVIKESANFANITFPASGVYTYEVTETLNVYTRPVGAEYTDVMAYSKAMYKVMFVVLQGTNGLYIAQIATYYMVDQVGGDPGGPKVDPTPGTDNSVGDYSQMIFENTYTKTENDGSTDPDDPDPDDPDPENLTIFRVEKLTTGNGGDPNKYFAFTVTVTEPEIGVVRGTYKAYVVDASGVVALGDTAGPNGLARDGDDSYGDYLLFVSGTARTVNLKSGQFLSFVDVEVGSKVLVSEAGEAGYVANYAFMLGGAAAAASTNTTANTTLATPTTGTGTNGQVLPYTGEGANGAKFTNDRTIEPLTGIAVADLPYYVLAALLALAVVGYVTFKVRRSAKRNAR